MQAGSFWPFHLSFFQDSPLSHDNTQSIPSPSVFPELQPQPHVFSCNLDTFPCMFPGLPALHDGGPINPPAHPNA